MKRYNLVGIDGNAYSVMGYVTKAMKKSGYSEDEVKRYLSDARSSDYHHLLFVSSLMVDEVNKKLESEGKISEDN